MKNNNFSENNPLTIDEILIAIAISAATSPVAQIALDAIPSLRGLDAHASQIIEKTDSSALKNLGISLSMEDIL